MDHITSIFSNIGYTLSSSSYWLGILSSLAILFIRHRIKRPKIQVSGSNSGGKNLEGGSVFSHFGLTIRNSPAFLGYPINRETLTVENARIYDPEKRRYEGHLMWWQGEPTDKPFKTEIKPGEQKSLTIYGIYDQRVHHYSGDTLHNIELSETLVEHGQTRKLEIHIFDNLTRRYRVPFKISAQEQRNHRDKVNVQVRTKTNIGDRFLQFKYGFKDMIGAFTRPNY